MRILAVGLVVTLAMVSQGSLPADAAGIFAASSSYPHGSATTARSVVEADFNGDGIKDVADATAYQVWVLLGTGQGSFSSPVGYSAANANGYSIAAGDLNGDSKPDLVVSGASPSVLLNNGNGTFGAATPYAVQSGGFGVALGDVNNDGKRDLVATNASNNTVSVLLGKGDGKFGIAANFATGPSPYSVAVLDLFKGDGKRDVVVTNYGANTVTALIGQGNGIFSQRVDYPTGSSPQYFTFADLNQDGLLDVLTTNSVQGTVSILLGNQAFGLKQPTSYSTGGNSYGPVAVGDMQNDRKLDLIAGNPNAGFSVLPGLADGTFGAPVPSGSSYGLAPLVRDLNHDGALDVILLDGYGISLFLNRAQSVSITPQTGKAGKFVTVTGAHYYVGETVTVKYKTGLSSPAAVVVCSTSTNSDGTFNCSGNIPSGSQAGALGAHKVTAKGQFSLAKSNATFTLTS
jgi:hypothetical protein